MSRVLIIIMLIAFLFSCKEKVKEEIGIDPEIKCLSAFIFGSRGDTIRNFLFTTYLFKKDTVLVLKPDSLARWNVKAIRLDSAGIVKLNKTLKAIEFKTYLNNTICKQIRDSGVMYCGPRYGFIDSSGHVETFVPFGKEKIIEDIFSYLRNKKSVMSTDTFEIMTDMEKIKRKYLKDCPPIPVLEKVEFVPPVNH